MEVFLVILLLALLVSYFHPLSGLILGSIAFFLAAAAISLTARGAIHEGTAATLGIGAFLCAGLAGIIRALSSVRVVADRMAEKVRADQQKEAGEAIAHMRAQREAEKAQRGQEYSQGLAARPSHSDPRPTNR